MLDEPPFWIVWNPNHPETPKRQFATRKEATRIARQMAEKHFGSYFYVLKAQSCHQRQVTMCDWTLADWGVGAPCQQHQTHYQ